MTVSSTTRKAGPFTGTGAVVAYPFSFKVFTTADIAVVRADTSGVETALVLNSDYTVSLNADQDNTPGGTVTLTTALASGYLLSLTGSLAYSQGTDLPTGGAFNAVNVEDALDRSVILTQQLLEKSSRTVYFPTTDPDSSLGPLPTARNRAGRYLVFDVDGKPSTSGQDVEALATAAAASATSASASAASATSSAAAASTSASAAAGSASAAAGAYANVQTTAASLAPTATQFSGNASQTAFTLPYTVTTKNLIDVYISGVYQQKANYSVLGTTLTFTAAPPSGTNNIEVITAANVTYTLPVSQDYGLITSAATAFADYGALV